MIEFKNVYIKYVDDFYTLYNFNCKINTHTLFIGDFYSGVNSIMRILAKIDKNYSGVCLIENTNLKEIKDKNLNIAYLPQTPVLFKNKSVFANLYFPLKLRKISKKTAKIKIDELLNKLNLKFLCKKIKHMTKSEQKLLCLIRAVLREPKYVLFENFFEDFEPNYIELANKIIDKIKSSSLILACEKNNDVNVFKDFNLHA